MPSWLLGVGVGVLTVVNVLQGGADPLTDGAEIADVSALTGDATATAAGAAGAASRTVVMGRNMAGRVIPYAEKNGYDYYAGTPR